MFLDLSALRLHLRFRVRIHPRKDPKSLPHAPPLKNRQGLISVTATLLANSVDTAEGNF